MDDITPSFFMKVMPMNSIFRKCEHEIVARNIMVILKRNGDVFRNITWEEYKEERLKDGSFTESEKGFFNDVAPYCISFRKVISFSRYWEEIMKDFWYKNPNRQKLMKIMGDIA